MAPGAAEVRRGSRRRPTFLPPLPNPAPNFARDNKDVQDSVVNVAGGGLSSGMDALPPCWLKVEPAVQDSVVNVAVGNDSAGYSGRLDG